MPGVADLLRGFPFVEHGSEQRRVGDVPDLHQVDLVGLEALERFLHLRDRGRLIAAAANGDLRRDEVFVAILELRENVAYYDFGSPVRRRRIDDASAELGKPLQRVAERRNLIGRRTLIDHRSADADDRQLLARRRNRSFDQRAGLPPGRFGAEPIHSAERERDAAADADLDRVAA